MGKLTGTQGNVALLGSLIANSNNRGLDIALNPAWRDTVVHFMIIERFRDGSPPEVVQGVFDNMTYNRTRALRQLDPDSGAYFNEVSGSSYTACLCPLWLTGAKSATHSSPTFSTRYLVEITRAFYKSRRSMIRIACCGAAAVSEVNNGLSGRMGSFVVHHKLSFAT